MLGSSLDVFFCKITNTYKYSIIFPSNVRLEIDAHLVECDVREEKHEFHLDCQPSDDSGVILNQELPMRSSNGEDFFGSDPTSTPNDSNDMSFNRSSSSEQSSSARSSSAHFSSAHSSSDDTSTMDGHSSNASDNDVVKVDDVAQHVPLQTRFRLSTLDMLQNIVGAGDSGCLVGAQ